jgi:hypothetical protein
VLPKRKAGRNNEVDVHWSAFFILCPFVCVNIRTLKLRKKGWKKRQWRLRKNRISLTRYSECRCSIYWVFRVT